MWRSAYVRRELSRKERYRDASDKSFRGVRKSVGCCCVQADDVGWRVVGGGRRRVAKIRRQEERRIKKEEGRKTERQMYSGMFFECLGRRSTIARAQ